MRFICGENLLKDIDEIPIYWRWFFKTLAKNSYELAELPSKQTIFLESSEVKSNNIQAAKIIKIPLGNFSIDTLEDNEYILTQFTKEENNSYSKNFIYLPPIIDDNIGTSNVFKKNNYVIVFDENYLNDFVLKRLIPIIKKNTNFTCIGVDYFKNSYDKIIEKLSIAKKILSATKNVQINHWLASICNVSDIPFLLFYDEVGQTNRYNKDDFIFYKIDTSQYSENVYSYGSFTSKIRKLIQVLKTNTAPKPNSINTFNYQAAINILSGVK